MLIIFAAMQDELKLIKAELEIDRTIHLNRFAVFCGKYYGKKIAIVRTGIGKEASKRAVEYCVENLDPSIIMDIGYAGGLSPSVQPGDIVIANSVIDDDSEKSWEVDKDLFEKAVKIAKSNDMRYQTGRSATVGKALETPHDKAFVGTKHEAVFCDMEASALAEIAHKNNIPFINIRSILDSMDTEIPAVPEKAIKDGKVLVTEFLGYLKSKPKDIMKLPKMSYLCNQARIAMTNFIKEWVKHEYKVL